MTALPTPLDVPVGHVVIVRLAGRLTYTSRVMSQSEAGAVAARIRKDVATLAHRDGAMADFECADGRTVGIKARAVLAVEPGPPPPLRERRAEQPVHVHLHVSGDAAAELVPVLGVSTEQVLAARAGAVTR